MITPQPDNRFKKKFSNKHVILPVIHVSSEEQAMQNANIVMESDADEILEARDAIGWMGLYFGGVAFKYQRRVNNLRSAARNARDYMDVVTTSGPRTGLAADIEKIRIMKKALDDFPLAIASGITPENVTEYLPYSDCYLVSTGISRNFEEFDPNLVELLVQTVPKYDQEN